MSARLVKGPSTAARLSGAQRSGIGLMPPYAGSGRLVSSGPRFTQEQDIFLAAAAATSTPMVRDICVTLRVECQLT